MKTLLSLVVVLAVIVQVDANVMKPESPVGVSVVQMGPLVKLFYRGEESGTVKVTIYNEKGRVVYSETMLDTEDFMRPYNFSALPSGVYTIELVDAHGTNVRKVEHALPDRKIVARVTRLSEGNHKYMLSVPENGSNKLTVRIYDDYNRLLYEGTEQLEGDFAKVYNLGAFKGRYIFELVDDAGNLSRLLQAY